MTKINEISKSLLKRYINIAGKDVDTKMKDARSANKDWKTRIGLFHKGFERNQNIKKAAEKLGHKVAKEETVNEEPIDNPELAAAIRGLANKRFGRTKRKAKSTTPEKGEKLKSGWNKAELTHYNAESAELAQIGMAAMGGMVAHSLVHHATSLALHQAGHHIKKIVEKIKTKRKGKVAAVKTGTSKDGTPANDNSPSMKPKVKITMTHGEETVDEARRGYNVVDEPYSLEKGKVGQSLGVSHFKRFTNKRAAEKELRQKINTGKTGPGYHFITNTKGERMPLNQSVKSRVRTKKEETQTFNEMMLERAKKLGIANQITYYAGKVNAEKA